MKNEIFLTQDGFITDGKFAILKDFYTKKIPIDIRQHEIKIKDHTNADIDISSYSSFTS